MEEESMVITKSDEFKEEQEEDPAKSMETLTISGLRGKERKKAAKKLKRKQARKEIAVKEREEEQARLNDAEEQRRIMLEEQEEAEMIERQRKEFEEREKLWIERAAKKAEEDAQRMLIEDESRENHQTKNEDELNDDDDWDYVEEGPAEIIWQGNEIIVKKKRVRVPKKSADQQSHDKDADRPTSNPLPPQSEAFASYKSRSSVSCQEVLESFAQQTPNFGTEQDKAHCPFHLKTGACRFGSRCSRVHFYPDKSCTLLIKNMYNGPGLAWEQDEGLEYTDEEVERCYEEFYEDVHTEFLKFGEIVNFKVCRNGSFHLRGNVYVHYKSLESAILAYNSINGRYFAGKQMTCEFVGVTRWKVAICGEYMKSRFKTCSHGTACNFIHCFRNPGGDYEWADWDNPPPKYWVKKMVALFGAADESTYEKCTGQDSRVQPRSSGRKITQNYERYHSRRSKSRDVYYWNSSSGGDSSDENRKGSSHSRRKHLGIGRYEDDSNFENDQFEGKSVTHDYDSGDSSSKEEDQRDSRSRTSSWHYKKGKVFPSDDSNIDDKNGYGEHGQYEGREVRIHDSTRRHSKSKDHSSRRDGSTRQTEKERVLDEHVASVNNCESENRIGHDCRSKSHDMDTGLNSSENIDQLDRWEAGTTFSGENEKYGNHNVDGNAPYIGNYKSHEERCDGQYSKIRSRCRSQSSQRTKSNSQEEEADSTEEDIHSKENHRDRISHDRRKEKKKATSETFPSEDANGKSDFDYTRFHHSGEHRRSHSRKHHGSSRREKHRVEYEKVENDKTTNLGAENLKPLGRSGKQSRSRSPAQHSRRSKRERHHVHRHCES